MKNRNLPAPNFHRGIRLTGWPAFSAQAGHALRTRPPTRCSSASPQKRRAQHTLRGAPTSPFPTSSSRKQASEPTTGTRLYLQPSFII